jgi:hypothetical protein
MRLEKELDELSNVNSSINDNKEKISVFDIIINKNTHEIDNGKYNWL